MALKGEILCVSFTLTLQYQFYADQSSIQGDDVLSEEAMEAFAKPLGEIVC